MVAGSSSLLTTYSPARACIYTAMLKDPASNWSVATLAVVFVPGEPVSRDMVRATLLVLLADNIVDEVPLQMSLTVRLAEQGTVALTTILTEWRSRGEAVQS